MDSGGIALVTDPSSRTRSGAVLAEAVRRLTGRDPVWLDARDFAAGGRGRARVDGGVLRLDVPGRVPAVSPAGVIVYAIPPDVRHAMEGFQQSLRESGAVCLGTDTQAWRTASDKALTVEAFARHGVPQMPTLCMDRPRPEEAIGAFVRLGGDVWARPALGSRGRDVFHLTAVEHVRTAVARYEASGARWLMAADAGNFADNGLRHQYRAVILEGEVIWAAEYVQSLPDAPCNLARGGVSTVLGPGRLPAHLRPLAVAATASMGLPFAGVDLAAENGGVVFEANLHPGLMSDGALEGIAVPYVQAHLNRLRARGLY
ncbi:RimK family alpha-L-glutamate ligase [Streptomyces sp. BBFR2]|uniref:ATP-grasp domain-containing protein n=1 Tax=Streptomyces sp. BBFR2 TaxID=3372854 RepID=UPI0037DA4694